MAVDYAWNEQAEAVAEKVIAAHHPRLERVRIAYLFARRPPRKKALRPGKRAAMAKTSTVGQKHRVLMERGFVFLIEFDQAVWDGLTLEQQEALVDHELCHCGVDADGYYLKQHDLEEFREIVRRHGFWKDDVKQFAEASLPLFSDRELADARTTVTLSGPGIGAVTLTGAEFSRKARRAGRKRVHA